jgi:C4-dicarboxylate transporter
MGPVVTAIGVLLPLVAFGFLTWMIFKAGGVKALFGLLLLLLGLWLGRTVVGAALASWISHWGSAFNVNPHIHQ